MKLSVIDTGVGISADKYTELFNAFTKIRQHRELNTEGVGLGLTVSKSLAIAMGGDITVSSEIDVGTVFIVTLPLVPA